jgi:Cadherin domain
MLMPQKFFNTNRFSHKGDFQYKNTYTKNSFKHLFHFSITFQFSFPASRIRYEITSGNIGGAFAVKNMTGAIYVAGALDYETRKRVS